MERMGEIKGDGRERAAARAGGPRGGDRRFGRAGERNSPTRPVGDHAATDSVEASVVVLVESLALLRYWSSNEAILANIPPPWWCPPRGGGGGPCVALADASVACVSDAVASVAPFDVVASTDAPAD